MKEGLLQRIEKLECNAKDEDCRKKCKGEKEKSNCDFAEVFVEDVNNIIDKTYAEVENKIKNYTKKLNKLKKKLIKQPIILNSDGVLLKRYICYYEIRIEELDYVLNLLDSERKVK